MINSKRFTLIELLVVVAVIGVLMTMLIPSLQKARLSGLTAVSFSNLRQIHVGSMIYMDENNGFFCLAATNHHPKNGNNDLNYRRLIYESIQGKPFATNWQEAQNEMANCAYTDLMFCPVLRNSREAKTQHSQGRGDYSVNRHFTEYRNISQIDGGKVEPFIVPGTPMGNNGSYASFDNTELGYVKSADYKFMNQQTLALFFAGHSSFMSLSQGAKINSLINSKQSFD